MRSTLFGYRKYEVFIMSNRRKFFINGIMLTLVGIAIKGVSIGFNSFVTRAIGAEGIGLYTLVMTVYSFALTFATSGISLTVTRLVSGAIGEGRGERISGILRSALIYSSIFSIFASLTLFFGAPYFANAVLSDSRAVLPLRILSFSLVPIALGAVFGGYFVGVKRVGKNAAVSVLGQVFKITVTVFFVIRSSEMGVEEGCIALCLSAAVTETLVFLVALFQFLADKRRYGAVCRKDSSYFHELCSEALPLAVSAYIRSALLSLEHILIPKRLRDGGSTHGDALASYGVLHGMTLPTLLYPMTPLSSFSGLLVPEFSERMARGDRSGMKRIADEAINTTLCYAVACASFLYLFSEELGYVIYSSYSAGHYIALMSPVIPIMYLDHVTDSILKGVGEQVYSMWVNITDSALSVILIFVLIPKMGIGGYALVIVIMEGYNFFLSAIRLRKRIPFSVSFGKSILLPFGAASVASFISREAFDISGSSCSPVLLLLKIVFALSVFLGIYLSLGRILALKKKAN